MGRLRDEAGMSMVEVMVAAAVLLTLVGATLSVLTASEQSVAGSQRRENAISVAQREIERIRVTRYAQLGLAAVPTSAPATTAANPSDPREYVSGANLLVRSNYRNRASAPPPGVPAVGEEFVLAGEIVSGPQFVQAGRDRFEVHRFISWVDRTCVVSGVERCAGIKDAKRLTVAVAAVAGATVRRASKPVWVSTVLTDPAAAPPATTVPPAGTPGAGETAQSFFFYDTRCSNAARVAPTASHDTHDTGRTGATCSAALDTQPDLMGIAPPPVTSPTPPFLDFATEVSRTGAAGAAIRRVGDVGDDDSHCRNEYAAADASSGRQSVHRWVSTPMAAPFSGGGRGALRIWTRSLQSTPAMGRLCLTVGRMNAAGTIVSTHQHVTHEIGLWPQEVTEVTFTFEQHDDGANGPPLQLAINERVVVELSLHDGSDVDAIEILYDHPDRQSAFVMATSTPIQP